ncbi:RE1 [Symbiodinium sp. CCMP2592]|nr:RE1 [Symbiodinium sp. CCMP2592]
MEQASNEVPPVPDEDDGDLDSRPGEAGNRPATTDDRAEYEEFQRWLRLRDRRGGWQDRRSPAGRRRDYDDDDDDGGSEFRTNAGPPPAWDGSECPFEDYLIRARIWISTTKAQARTRGPLLLKSLSSTPFQDFKHLAKDPAWLSNPDNAEVLLKKMDSPEFYGDDQDEHLLASLARVTYHLKRQRNETARQFLGRWEAAERKVQEHKVLLPSLYRGFLMINALGLSDPEIKTLLTFTHGSIEPKDIKTWLRKHETKLQAGQIGNDLGTKAKGVAGVHMMDQEEPGVATEDYDDDEIGAMEAMLADLEEEEAAPEDAGVFNEDEAAEILAIMIKEKRKTYTQSAQIKKDKELGRGYRSGGGHPGARDRQGPIRPGTYKLSIAELKQRTKCKRCGKIGHWHRECPQPAPASGSKETHLLEVEIDSYDDALFCHFLEVESAETPIEGDQIDPDHQHRSIEPQGCGKGRDDFEMKLFRPELVYMPGRVYDVWFSEFDRYEDDACATIDTGCQRTQLPQLFLLRVRCPNMDCASPTNKRAREQSRPTRVNVIYLCWQRVIMKVAVLATGGPHGREHELRDDLNEVLNQHQSEEFKMFMQYREWKKSKSSAGSSKDGSFMMVRPADDDDNHSQVTFESGYTHFNTRTGSRGRRLSTPSPSSQPRGPPPPLPVNQPVTMSMSSSSKGRSNKNKFSPASDTATNVAPERKTDYEEKDQKQLEREANLVVTDKKVQQEIFTATFNVLWRDIPTCQCNLACKVELSATTQNPNRVFFNCPHTDPKHQCGAFAWAPVQPLLDEEYAETRQRVCRGFPRSLTARESLVRVLQDLCPHHSVVASGSNAFVRRTRCRACQKVISIEHKNSGPTEVKNSGPTEMKNSSDTESFNPEDYQAFLQWKRDRWKAAFDVLRLDLEGSSPKRDGSEPLSFCDKKKMSCALNLSDRALKQYLSHGDSVACADMSTLVCPSTVQEFLQLYRQAHDLSARCMIVCDKHGRITRDMQYQRVVQQCLQHASKTQKFVILIAPDLRALTGLSCDHGWQQVQGKCWHMMCRWPLTPSGVSEWLVTHEGSCEEVVAELRKHVATYCRVPWSRVQVHEVNELQAEADPRNPNLDTIPPEMMVERVQQKDYLTKQSQNLYTIPPEMIDERVLFYQKKKNPMYQEQAPEPMNVIYLGLGNGLSSNWILKAAKATEEVVDIARKMKCSVCEKFAVVRPPRKAAPPREYGINEVIGMDTVWLPTVGQKKKRVALNIIDYSSHFQMMIPLRGRSPEAAWAAYRQWVKFFGPPKQILADQGSEFKGSFKVRTAQEGTRMDPSSLEAPTQRGLAERHGKTFKLILEKTMADYNCTTYGEWLELVDVTMMVKNRLASRGGFSPIQRVLGYLPRLPGGLLSGGQDDAEMGSQPKLGDAGLARAMEIRKAAAKAFFEVDSDQALRNVLAGGPRPQFDYVTGQMVGHSKKGDRPHQRWHGPARVIMTDYPSTIWLSYQGSIVKAAPERIRPGSEEENLTISGWLNGLTNAKADFEREPRRGYIDLSDEPVPDEIEDLDEDDEEKEVPELPGHPVLRRLRRKTDLRVHEGDERDAEPDEIMPDIAASETPQLEAADGEARPEATVETGVPATPDEDDEGDEEVEPPPKRTRVQMLEAYYAKLETLFKTRQRKEVKLRELNKLDLQCFLKATEREVNNNLETGAYEKLDAETSETIRRTKPDRIMESRYVRTIKPLEPGDIDKAAMDGTLLSEAHGGPCKAKVRHVMKGFSEEGAEDLDSATPQVTREGVMFTTQVIASKRWDLGFLDFTQAFHSGDPIQRELYAEQPPEGVPGMQKGDLLKLLKTCYGLLDGPMAWFRHLRKVLLEEMGYIQSLADPCIYFLHDSKKTGWDRLIGIVSVATDDLLHGGGPEHKRLMEQLNKKYKLGKFQYGSGRFTGKQFTPQPDGSIVIDQNHYVQEKVHKIVLSKQRKAQRYSRCNEEEIAQMRSLVGALSWLAKETRPDLSGRVSLLQQQFPKPRIGDILKANQLANEAEKFPVGIRVTPIPIQRLRVSAVSDASWGNAEDGEAPENETLDFWTETPELWIRHHVKPRRTLFHPGMTDNGPDLHGLKPERITRMRQDGSEHEKTDTWNQPRLGIVQGEAWTGQTVFQKCEAGIRHQDISEGFIQNRRMQSQGGHLIIFHDQNLQFEPSAMISITSWKSYRLKRKVVNTLAAECQALVNGIGNVHWHRFLMMEAQGDACHSSDWEGPLTKIPYLAVTDSKSLFDALSKQTCPYSQIEDKRTAIDISIVKHELSKGGTVRWIDGRNMISDSLTKSTGGNYLRYVMTNGRWLVAWQPFVNCFAAAMQTSNRLLKKRTRDRFLQLSAANEDCGVLEASASARQRLRPLSPNDLQRPPG